MDCGFSKIGWNIFVGVDKWPGKCKVLVEFGKMLISAKDKISKECRIRDTCFRSLATIGRNFLSNHPNNLINVHKGKNDVLSVIITLGTNVNGGEKVFR